MVFNSKIIDIYNWIGRRHDLKQNRSTRRSLASGSSDETENEPELSYPIRYEPLIHASLRSQTPIYTRLRAKFVPNPSSMHHPPADISNPYKRQSDAGNSQNLFLVIYFYIDSLFVHRRIKVDCQC